MWLGGDFNCQLHGTVDRTNLLSTARHDSSALAALISRWVKEYALRQEMSAVITIEERAAFVAKYHTDLSGDGVGGTRSSTFDQWYVMSAHADWVRRCAVRVPGSLSDHNGVVLVLSNPAFRMRRKMTAPVYPLAGSAAELAASRTTVAINDLELALKVATATIHDATGRAIEYARR